MTSTVDSVATTPSSISTSTSTPTPTNTNTGIPHTETESSETNTENKQDKEPKNKTDEKDKKGDDKMKAVFDQLYKMTIDSLKIIAAIMRPSKICIFGFYSNGTAFFENVKALKQALGKVVVMLTYLDIHWKELSTLSSKQEHKDHIIAIIKQEAKEHALGKVSATQQRIVDYLKEYDELDFKFQDAFVNGMSNSGVETLIKQVYAEIAVGLSKLSLEIANTCQFILDNKKLLEYGPVNYASKPLHDAAMAVKKAMTSFTELKRGCTP